MVYTPSQSAYCAPLTTSTLGQYYVYKYFVSFFVDQVDENT